MATTTASGCCHLEGIAACAAFGDAAFPKQSVRNRSVLPVPYCHDNPPPPTRPYGPIIASRHAPFARGSRASKDIVIISAECRPVRLCPTSTHHRVLPQSTNRPSGAASFEQKKRGGPAWDWPLRPRARSRFPLMQLPWNGPALPTAIAYNPGGYKVRTNGS